MDFDWDAKGFFPGCKGEFDLDFTGMQRDFRDVRGNLTWILTGMQRDFYRGVRGNFTWILLGCKGIFIGV